MRDYEKRKNDESIVLWDQHVEGFSNGKRVGITLYAFLLPYRHIILIYEERTGREEEIEMVRVPETVIDKQSAIVYLEKHGYTTY